MSAEKSATGGALIGSQPGERSNEFLIPVNMESIYAPWFAVYITVQLL